MWHHHTCVATSNLLLVKWTNSRVSQFVETATNLHKRGNVLVFIVHTPSKSQVWGNIQVKQLSFINRWIVRRRKKWDRKHSRIMTVDKEIEILLSSKWFWGEKISIYRIKPVSIKPMLVRVEKGAAAWANHLAAHHKVNQRVTLWASNLVLAHVSKRIAMHSLVNLPRMFARKSFILPRWRNNTSDQPLRLHKQNVIIYI